jgi:enediyne biosynthesis protein E4
VLVKDENDDGNLDILSVGNSYATETLTGFYDAGIGNYLQGDGTGNFQPVYVTTSGFFVDGDSKALSLITLSNGNELFLVTQNRDSLKVFGKRDGSSTEGSPNVTVNFLTNSAIITLKNGKKRKHEFYYGSGYLSSSSRKLAKKNSIEKITLSKE